MITQKNLFVSFSAMCIALFMGETANAQFIETMGTAGSSTETIAVHETNNRFDQIAHTYSGTADMRTTTPSTGYLGASGSFNTLIQAQETFVAQDINASMCGVSDSISFGIFKSTNASTGVDFLVLEYSINGGSSWVNIPFTALPTGSGTSHWYQRKVLLPAAAHISTLWLRFRSTLTGGPSANPQFRIDDLTFTCGTTSGENCSNLVSLVEPESSMTTFCAEIGTNAIYASTNMTSPNYQWYNQDGILVGETGDFIRFSTSGTYYAVITNAAGCSITTDKTYILVYPQPEFCPISIEGCEGDTVEACAELAAKGLLISEYVEGTGNNKYLELYNGTCGSVDLSDYVIRAYHNGVNVPTFTISLTGTLASGATYVIANTSATIWTGTPDLVTNNLAFNGNDALVLFNTVTGITADIFGSVGYDPGASWKDATVGSPTLGWSTENKTLVRKSCIYSGIDTRTDLGGISGFKTLTTEWDTLTVNSVSGLGSHVFGPSSYSFALVSGSTVIASSAGKCAQIVIGSGVSSIAIDASFCALNDCEEINNLISVTDTCRAERSLFTSAQEPFMTTVFPNPFTEVVTVNYTVEQEGLVTVTIFNLTGEAVLSQTITSAKGNQEMELNLESLSAGTYICHIHTTDRSEEIRIVKSK
ncbi:MAG: lamin tail domain-containing protein [Bacteroidota bacterium]